MTEAEALDLVRHHSYTHEDIENPKTKTGFLGMLRPFTGRLYEANFIELMTALRVLSPQFKGPVIDRELIAAYWNICHLGRAWGLEPEGMLQRNNLLTANQIKDLASWIDCLSDTVANLLDGADETLAFEAYQFYLANGAA